jgi:hypothetical protein
MCFLIFAQVPALQIYLLTNATFAIKIQSIRARPANSKVTQRQQVFAPWAAFQFNCSSFIIDGFADSKRWEIGSFHDP